MSAANTVQVTCYVDAAGDLVIYQTAERLRRATTAERRASGYMRGDISHTGAFTATVAIRTVKQRSTLRVA